MQRLHLERFVPGRGVHRRQLDLLHQFSLRLLTNPLNAALLVAVLWGQVPAALLVGWLVLVTLVVVVRLYFARRYRSRFQPDAALPRWAFGFMLGALLSGALWGSSATVIWLTPEIAYHVFISFVIAGMSAAAVATTYAFPPAAYAFLLASVLPLALALLSQGGALYLVMGTMTALYVLFLTMHIRMSNLLLLRSFSLEEENQALIADLSAARDSLERRVQERTAELEAANLALQDEMQARARSEHQLRQMHRLEAIGQLTGGVAHDFNNLLAIIQGNAELIRDGDAEAGAAGRAILRAAERGSELTQRLMAFSRQQALQPRAIDLAGLVDGMSSLLSRTLGETIEIETRVEDGVWSAMADPGQVENALLNLAINARDAMPHGGRLTIECANATAEPLPIEGDGAASGDAFVVLTVRDNGFGMAAPIAERAFEPFFTTKEVGKGSGLGLSMVYGFAKQSGGHVAIESELDKGTTVRLFLPRGDALASSDAARPRGAAPKGRGERVLVVEDNDELRSLTTRMLEGLGYRVDAVSDALDARERLGHDGAFDLVLSDVVLPGGVSGRDLAREVAARQPPIKVLLMSGYPSAAGGQGTSAILDEAILRKPFTRDQLARALRTALDG